MPPGLLARRASGARAGVPASVGSPSRFTETSIPGLPEPFSGIGGLNDVLASPFGLPSEIAEEAVGGLPGVANSNLPSGTGDALASSIPGARGLLSETRGSLLAGASLDDLGDIGALPGDGVGASTARLTDTGFTMGDFPGSAVGDDTMEDQISHVFP